MWKPQRYRAAHTPARTEPLPLILKSSGNATKERQKVRARLYKENPNCPKCGVKMILPESLPWKARKSGVIPLNCCTFEHVYSKWSPYRFTIIKEAILCYKCNNAKGKQDQDDFKLLNSPILIKLKEDIDIAYEEAMIVWNIKFENLLNFQRF